MDKLENKEKDLYNLLSEIILIIDKADKNK